MVPIGLDLRPWRLLRYSTTVLVPPFSGIGGELTEAPRWYEELPKEIT